MESVHSQQQSDEGWTRSRVKIILVLSALCISVFLSALDAAIVTTALPYISAHFKTAKSYAWIGNAYLFASAASAPIWGALSGLLGNKLALIIANVVFTIGSVLSAVAVSPGMLVVGRAVQGIGGGGIVVLVNITISVYFDIRARSKYLSLIAAIWAIATPLGPIIGGALTQRVTWRWIFYINLPPAGLALILVVAFLESRSSRNTPAREILRGIDWLGAVTVVSGTIMVLLGLNFGGVDHPWTSAMVVCLIVFGVTLWAIFLLNEWTLAKQPLIPLRMFRTWSNAASLFICFVHSIAMIGGPFYLTFYFQTGLGAPPLLSGVYLLPSFVSASLAAPLAGFFIAKTGRYLVAILVGLLLMTLGFGLYSDLDARSSWAKIILYQILASFGVGINFQAPLIAIQAGTQSTDLAKATATFSFVRQLAGSISVVIGAVTFQNQMNKRYLLMASKLGEGIASQLRGISTGANFRLVDNLPAAEKNFARSQISDSLRIVWTVYLAFCVSGVLASCLVNRRALPSDQKEAEKK